MSILISIFFSQRFKSLSLKATLFLSFLLLSFFSLTTLFSVLQIQVKKTEKKILYVIFFLPQFSLHFNETLLVSFSVFFSSFPHKPFFFFSISLFLSLFLPRFLNVSLPPLTLLSNISFSQHCSSPSKRSSLVLHFPYSSSETLPFFSFSLFTSFFLHKRLSSTLNFAIRHYFLFVCISFRLIKTFLSGHVLSWQTFSSFSLLASFTFINVYFSLLNFAIQHYSPFSSSHTSFFLTINVSNILFPLLSSTPHFHSQFCQPAFSIPSHSFLTFLFSPPHKLIHSFPYFSCFASLV